MATFNYPSYPTQPGYMTDKIRSKYTESAIKNKLLPANAHRLEPIVSLVASNDPAKPILFWQLFSVLGPQRIVAIVDRFYERVFNDEPWFRTVFSRIASKERHVQTQAAMWADVMGGGQYYHGGEYRLNFHHTHNAMELMNAKGAERWVSLMRQTLNEPGMDYTDDPRVRPAINTFLDYFMDKYAEEFNFEADSAFGETNPAWVKRLNFLNMTTEAIEALTEDELIAELNQRGVDVGTLVSKSALVNRALNL